MKFLLEQIKHCNLCPLSKVRNNSICQPLSKVDILFVSLLYQSSFEPASYIDFSSSFGYTSLLKCEPKSASLANFSKNFDIKNCANICKVYLQKELELLAPKVIIALGSEVFSSLAGEQEHAYSVIKGGIYRLDYSFIMPCYSLEFLAKNPSQKLELKADLQKIKGLV